MLDRKKMILKKSILVKMKKQLEQLESVTVIDFIDKEYNEKINYYSLISSNIQSGKSKKISEKKWNGNIQEMAEWIAIQFSFLRDENILLMPFTGDGIWWVKVRLNNFIKAIEDLLLFGDILAVDESEKVVFYIGIEENNYQLFLERFD